MKAFVLFLITLLFNNYAPMGDCYDAYGNGVHYIISDNGTPGNLFDDFVCDYETDF